ncbi:MAG: hypothetical protein E7197_07700 [Anaerovibrio sp.]|uniref:hypothetical protein n=1 Tax=Anaerovibrio sp. TaxID=1872532 RepID=UPI0025BCE8CA|nr:hypothetical protein [Anaerovibrio sp.]MBE6099923.1 hypothetical protein [Anaerovibrio sp.]
MGSRGSFLESGGFSTPARWQTVGYVNGIKVLKPKNPEASLSLPERSNTPGTAYVSYNKDGSFKQFIIFGNDRLPVYRIDYGIHRGKKSLHIHFMKGNKNKSPKILKPHHILYKKHKDLFKGV